MDNQNQNSGTAPVINPDLIAPQGATPIATTPLTTSHIVDITPSDTNSPIPPLNSSTPTTQTQPPEPVIENSGMHLADIASSDTPLKEVAPLTPLSTPTAPTAEPALTTTPQPSPTITEATTPSMAPTTPVTPAAPITPVPPTTPATPASPFAEDPDQVKTIA